MVHAGVCFIARMMLRSASANLDVYHFAELADMLPDWHPMLSLPVFQAYMIQ